MNFFHHRQRRKKCEQTDSVYDRYSTADKKEMQREIRVRHSSSVSCLFTLLHTSLVSYQPNARWLNPVVLKLPLLWLHSMNPRSGILLFAAEARGYESESRAWAYEIAGRTQFILTDLINVNMDNISIDVLGTVHGNSQGDVTAASLS